MGATLRAPPCLRWRQAAMRNKQVRQSIVDISLSLAPCSAGNKRHYIHAPWDLLSGATHWSIHSSKTRVVPSILHCFLAAICTGSLCSQCTWKRPWPYRVAESLFALLVLPRARLRRVLFVRYTQSTEVSETLFCAICPSAARSRKFQANGWSCVVCPKRSSRRSTSTTKLYYC